jgi:hypothetical protein
LDIEFDNQLLETPNLAKLTNLDALERKLRKALKLEDYRTPLKVVSSVKVPSMQSTNIDALKGSSKLSLLFKEQFYTFYRSDVKSIMDLYFIDTPILNSGSKYPLLRSLSILLLDCFKELLTLDNNTMDVCTLILTVVSIDFVNTYYQTLKFKHCVKQALGPFLGS